MGNLDVLADCQVQAPLLLITKHAQKTDKTVSESAFIPYSANILKTQRFVSDDLANWTELN